MSTLLINRSYKKFLWSAVLSIILISSGLIVTFGVKHQLSGNILIWGGMIALLFYLGSLQDLARHLGKNHVLLLVLTILFFPLSLFLSLFTMTKAVKAHGTK